VFGAAPRAVLSDLQRLASALSLVALLDALRGALADFVQDFTRARSRRFVAPELLSLRARG
jgi:hypothetical protein